MQLATFGSRGTVTTNLTEADNSPDTASDQIWRAVVGAYDSLASRSRPTLCKSRR
jgi:hypothetical protein